MCESKEEVQEHRLGHLKSCTHGYKHPVIQAYFSTLIFIKSKFYKLTEHVSEAESPCSVSRLNLTNNLSPTAQTSRDKMVNRFYLSSDKLRIRANGKCLFNDKR